ncbi:MAG TPA: DapH/DapD/GlmU-related protein [Rhizomicrobium sp.]|nr:DapH/DapD/GlmU-related protein [Rhizomicrobium sp.]
MERRRGYHCGMFSTVFLKSLTIDSEKQLRELFATDTLYLAQGATLTVEGEIALGPNVMFEGANRLAGPLRIEQGCQIKDLTLGKNGNVRAHSVLSGVTAGENNLFGPFCFVRDGCEVGSNCILGAHFEGTRSTFGSGVKISHRAFVGDAVLGDDTIIGAGVVFCNYADGKRLSTTVGAKVLVGSGTLLVPPLSIGDGAVIAAGSLVTRDVAAGAKIIQKRRTET